MDVDTIPVEITLIYDRDGAKTLSPPRRVRIKVTPPLAGAIGRAATVNPSDSTPLNFASLLLGLITGPDDFSAWLETYLEGQAVTPQKIASRGSLTFTDELLFSMRTAPPPTEVAVSMSARRAIEEAQAIAAALETEGPVDIRHVGAAYPVLPDWHVDDFRELGIDRLKWCRAMGNFMAKSFERERRYWRDYADRAAPVPLTSFSADVYTEEDLLGIDRSVDALALLTASTRTDTPLSIGVFGQWGSGKSFFMRHLRKRIWTLATREEKRTDAWKKKRAAKQATVDDAPLYFGRIAQVEFNAWHYNEGNVVASLVDHLFRNLHVLGPDEKDAELENRRAVVMLQISGIEADLSHADKAIERTTSEVKDAKEKAVRADANAKAAQTDVMAKSEELEATKVQAESARHELDVAIQEVTKDTALPEATVIADVAFKPLTDSPVVAHIRSTVENLEQELKDWKGVAAQLFSARGALVVALILAAPAIWWLTGKVTAAWATFFSFATTVAAYRRHAFELIQEGRRKFEAEMSGLREEETRQRARLEEQLRKKQADIEAAWANKLGDLQASLEDRRATLAEREAAVTDAVNALADRTGALNKHIEERSSAQKRLQEAEAQLKRLNSALLLDEFIKDRSGTDEYRKQLGFLALVRRDFERLSNLIAASNSDWLSPMGTSDAPLLNRIVLYIDDLDRCNVETVLKVLEIVHLLLAFRLFVCVVAVDPQWIEECLRQKHQYLFGAKLDGKEDGNEAHAPKGQSNAANPRTKTSNTHGHDGEPRVTVGDYLEKIFQIPIWMSPIDNRQRAAVVKSLLGTTAAPEARDGRTGTVDNRPEPNRPPTVEERAADGFQAALTEAQATRDPLRITRDEAIFVDRVAPLLSDKPRALKRFVNTYRLLKASLSDIDREGFVTKDVAAPYTICIAQLAMFTGHPRLAPRLVRQLALTNASQFRGSLHSWVEELPKDTKETLEDVLVLVPDSHSMTMEKFTRWIPETSKYLFHRD